MVFNIAESIGGRSREAYAPSLLELYEIPYTFSDPLTCALTLDKNMAKKIIAQASIATAAFKLIQEPADLEDLDLRLPLFAKPCFEGTGKGITAQSYVSSFEQLQSLCKELLLAHNQPVLVEEYLPGREFTVGIIGNGEKARILGTMEITMLSTSQPAIYSFVNKELCDEKVRYSRLSEGSLKRKVEKLALDSYRVLECRDASRVDIRCDTDGEPCFMEINPLAGLHPSHSDLCIIATQEGISYNELIAEILENAFARVANNKKINDICTKR